MLKRKKSSGKQVSRARSRSFFAWAPPFAVPAGIAIIAAAVFLAYLPAINGGFVLDDDLMITENKLVKASDGLYRFWCTTEEQDYWPLTYSTFWIEWRLWGRNSTGYHVLNLVLHVVESLLIWLILRKLSIPGAFFAAVIFAVHPVNVESVAWIAQRKNTMAMLFFLLSILCYMKFLTSARIPLAAKQTPPTAHRQPPTFSSFYLWYWLSLAAFVLAMLSKGSVAILPVLLLGIVWWLRYRRAEGDSPIFVETKIGTVPEKLGQSPWRDLARTAPFFLVAAVLAGVNVWFQTKGTGEVFRTANYIERLLSAGGAVWFYIYKAVFPIDLAFVYPLWRIEAGNPLWWLPLAAALIVTIALLWYRKSWSRPLLFAWGFFCVALVPVLGFTDVGFMKYSLVADRYQHIAIIGVAALAAAGWSLWRDSLRGGLHRAAIIVPIAAMTAFMYLTFQQSKYYRNEIALYRVTLEKNPDCWLAHNNLGFILAQIGRSGEAVEQFREAVRINANYPFSHNNLSSLLLKAGRTEEAFEHAEQAVRLKPDYPEAQCNLGAALIQLGRPAEAIDHFRKALALKPDYIDVLNNLGVALVQTGQPEEAIPHYQKAVQLNPYFIEARANLGIALCKAGRLREAIEQLQQVLAQQPDVLEAHVNLGIALYQTDRPLEAIKHFQQALKLKPDYAEVHNNLGNALAQTGQLQEAIEHFKEALRLRPEYIKAYSNLALVYSRNNQPAEAEATARKALELARAQGETALVKEIEDWLNSHSKGIRD